MDYRKSLNFWEAILLKVNDNKRSPAYVLATIAKDAISAPAGNGPVERSMNPIKQQHNANRASLGKPTVSQLIYITDNTRFCDKFEAI